MTVPEKIEQLPGSIPTLLFHAARELLFNAVKHAGVKNARIEVTKPGGFIELLVEDKEAGCRNARSRRSGLHRQERSI
jgi:signal transduction histidine kinase